MTIPVADHDLPEKGIKSFHYQRSDTHKHQGIDIPADEGTPVLAARDGLVEIVNDTDHRRQGFTGYGKVVVLLHTDGKRTLYAHLADALVDEGQAVEEGEKIGTVGRTKYSNPPDYNNLFGVSGSHLHFEVSPGKYPQGSEDTRVDPVAWLRTTDSSPMPGPLNTDKALDRLQRADNTSDWLAWGFVFLGLSWISRKNGR